MALQFNCSAKHDASFISYSSHTPFTQSIQIPVYKHSFQICPNWCKLNIQAIHQSIFLADITTSQSVSNLPSHKAANVYLAGQGDPPGRSADLQGHRPGSFSGPRCSIGNDVQGTPRSGQDICKGHREQNGPWLRVFRGWEGGRKGWPSMSRWLYYFRETYAATVEWKVRSLDLNLRRNKFGLSYFLWPTKSSSTFTCFLFFLDETIEQFIEAIMRRQKNNNARIESPWNLVLSATVSPAANSETFHRQKFGLDQMWWDLRHIRPSSLIPVTLR